MLDSDGLNNTKIEYVLSKAKFYKGKVSIFGIVVTHALGHKSV